MRGIRIADMTMRSAAMGVEYSLNFKERLELARELDGLGVDVIEFPPLGDDRSDVLLVRTAATLARRSVLSVPTGLTVEGVEKAWSAVSAAVKPRLLVCVPVSPVQMEYMCHAKPAQLLTRITELVSAAAALCPDVEFSAEDATRADFDYLCSAVETALEAGAGTVNISDSAGLLLPNEQADFIRRLYERVPALKEATLSVQCSDALSMAAACAMAAVAEGVGQVKCSVSGTGLPTIESLAAIFRARGDTLEVRTGLDMTGLARAVGRMTWLTSGEPGGGYAFDGGLGQLTEELALDGSTSPEELERVLDRLGYELGNEDLPRVHEAFLRIARKKTVGARELDAIVAGAALQVPATYKLVSYVINSGNIIQATANIVLEKDGEQRHGLVGGDGPVDAAFLAVEQAVGRHYELDDFQISAVTEGREAMGSTLVKLRHGGRLYSGQGVSTDVIGASIRAYLDAINKIAYEERENG